MSMFAHFDSVLSFCDEYRIKPRSTYMNHDPHYPSVTLMVDGDPSNPSPIHDELFWQTDIGGITYAKLVFDGIDYTIQIFSPETREGAA